MLLLWDRASHHVRHLSRLLLLWLLLLLLL
jgi:hypothetical protein